MRNSIVIPVFVFLNSTLNMGISQNTINLISGKQINAKVIEIKDSYIYYQIKKNDKIKDKFIEKEDIFSISNINNADTILYQQDSTKGFTLNIQQMSNYVYGEQTSWKIHKTSKFIIIGGGVCGASVGIIGIYGLLIPASYSSMVSLINPKVQYTNNKVSPENIDSYNKGYIGIAKLKNTRNSIISGLFGIAATIIILSVVK